VSLTALPAKEEVKKGSHSPGLQLLAPLKSPLLLAKKKSTDARTR
jgi:hypothetical protein